MIDQAPAIYTIGHSTHPLEVFFHLLHRHDVTAVLDVRSAPYSRFAPHFNKDALQISLRDEGIDYVFRGDELGARPRDPTCYVDGRVSYARIAAMQTFDAGLNRVVEDSRKQRVALMCAEREPLECHRTLLVAQALHARGVPVLHILADGAIEHHDDAMLRLLGLVGLASPDLFRTHEELLLEARAIQEARIAYVDARLASEAAGEKA